MRLTFTAGGPVRATRETGRADRERLEELARDANAGDVIEIDLSQVDALTISYADELVGLFLAGRVGGEQDDLGVVIRGGNSDVRETVEAVLQRRSIGAIYVDEFGRALALGGPSWFAQTVAHTQELKVFRAADLAERLELSPQAANGRLKQLSASGAVLRERTVPEGGGKEFEYRAAVAS
jgi:hypothetical protein